ncbi:MAG: LysM peptidoglycan-binding domain-containing protein [Syntrophales bacterium]
MIFLPLLPAPLSAREDSASLLLQKSVGSSNSRVYVMKKGESIRSVLRSQPGYEPVSRAAIRRLNPDIPDLDRVYPGQRIVLPTPGRLEPSVSVSSSGRKNSPQPAIYRIQEGDSISRVILSELNMNPAEALPAYRLIRKLNPEIRDLNRLPVGQTLRLPPAPARSAISPPAQPQPQTQTQPQQATTPPTGKPDAAAKMIADSLFGIIRPVIGRMRGAVTVAGSYHIPLQETTQITIDCAQIPVVELDDGTTVLLDYGDRLSENLKRLIRQSWKNYAFLTAEELRDELGGLSGIIRHSQNYKMVRTDKPLELTAKPEILVFPDWVISGKTAVGGVTYRQGLFLLDRDERPLPEEARRFIEKNGIAVTEITEGHAVSSMETPSALQPIITDLRDMKGIAFVEKLLLTLGETPTRNTEVVVFDQARNGFNLSVTADLLIRKGEKRFIIHTKKLPEQFVLILRDAGAEVIPIRERDQGRSLIEGTLQGLGISVSFGYFSFRIPQEGKRPRLTGSISTLRAMNGGEPIFLIDFDLAPAVLPFFSGRRGERVIRY